MVIPEPDVGREKLLALLDEGHESERLDYKSECALDDTRTRVEIAKDVCAMQALGGYLALGVGDDGTVVGLTPAALELLDESIVRAKMRRYLDEPLALLVCRHTLDDGKALALLYIGPSPLGIGVMTGLGAYPVPGSAEKVVFQAGDCFVRRGSASVRANPADLRAAIERVVEGRKESWLREIRGAMGDLIQAALPGLAVTRGPASALTWRLDAEVFRNAIVEYLRVDDDVPIRLFLTGVRAEAAALLAEQDVDGDVQILADRIACLGAVALILERPRWLTAAVDALGDIYALREDESGGYGAPSLESGVFFASVASRAFALGGLAVRRRAWGSIRALVLRQPVSDFYASWLRHADVMRGRAARPSREDAGLLARAREISRRESCLGGDVRDDDELLESLCQFNFLESLLVVAETGKTRGAYPHFGRFFSRRTEPIARQLLEDDVLRQTIFPGSDEQLASALLAISSAASGETMALYNGWDGYEDPVVRRFLQTNAPAAG